jgi:hypothetical protein
MKDLIPITITLLCSVGCEPSNGSPIQDGRPAATDMSQAGMSDVHMNPDNGVLADANSPTDSTRPEDAVALARDRGTQPGDAASELDSGVAPILDMARPMVDAALIVDMMTVPIRMCPEENPNIACLFGATSRALQADQRLQVIPGIQHRRIATMGPLEQNQLVHGFACEGVFAPATAEAALRLVDDGVQVYTVRRVNPDGLFTWFRFYMGDTEVGYLFRQGTMALVAIVSDQDIVNCRESQGDRPPMTCTQLDQCLQGCNQVDLECRRPCLRASDPDAVDAYITLDECRSDCAGDAACLDRICGDERATCFGNP